ncbi:hypothetical protein ABRT01_15775 [Lentibacillus sp. L22]|uniref:hypothetical protein n=1 Tax=Lentibacillus TaxID=175304 RepID=UPI0022B1A04D|nr:hypothetical protein [Lentibacillus daqui]
MDNQVFLLLKERYEQSGVILSARELQRTLPKPCTSEYVVEGIYRFDAYLDMAQRDGNATFKR